MADLNFDALFGNFTAADALAATETKKTAGYSNLNLYKPSIKDENCKDKNYRAVVRFIPFLSDGEWKTTISRWETYLKDVNGENGIFVVSPKTVGKQCPIRSLGWKLHTSTNAYDKANSEKINVYQQFYALVEVVKDVQHPEYDGKFFIYQFGKIINDKILTSMNSTDFEDGFNPFDLYNGNLFEINLKEDTGKKMGGRSVTNYDQCRVINRTAPIHFGTEGDIQTLEASRPSQSAFVKWLDEGAPNIKEYLWKEWDSETIEKVNANLATYTSSYSAPRSTVAAVKETVGMVDDTSSVPPVASPVQDIEDLPESTMPSNTEFAGDDDAWISSIING